MQKIYLNLIKKRKKIFKKIEMKIQMLKSFRKRKVIFKC
jgi:predicted DNA-binding protein YlxM (UPF0122 family)